MLALRAIEVGPDVDAGVDRRGAGDEALEEGGARGNPARVGPGAFAEIDVGAPIEVATPAQGGDGRARDDPRASAASARASAGTMKSREEALREKNSAALTTD